MLFNSIEFAIFLPLVFSIYWLLHHNGTTVQNSFLLISSYVFYGWWDWRFLSLIFLSSTVDFTIGHWLYKKTKAINRQVLLLISILFNIGMLGFFKYYNFFVDSFVDAFSFFGRTVQTKSLHIVLPVGISFYTFQTLSYTIDIYKKKIKPTKDVVAFFSFVSFFPQLVAGPIERASNLLPQFKSGRDFSYEKASNGMRQILWGLLKKIVIADNCAIYANRIFDHYTEYSGSTLLLGAIFFAFQIYGDFSGYSDIAIGTAKLFGFSLRKNFSFPYFSRDIAEFWRRWHISLSSWFRDYVYIPLGGSRGSEKLVIRNIFIVFIISGFWHGANWTFIAWGALHACFFLPLLILKLNRKNLDIVAQGKLLPNFTEFVQILTTFLLVCIAWIFFRSTNLKDAISIIQTIFSSSFFSIPEVLPFRKLLLLFIFILIEWFQREKEHGLDFGPSILKAHRTFRIIIYYAVIIVIWKYQGIQQEFIYFQF